MHAYAGHVLLNITQQSNIGVHYVSLGHARNNSDSCSPNEVAQRKSSTYGGAMPEKLPGGREVRWLQKGRVSLPKLHHIADKGCQGGVIQGVLRDDRGALA